MKYAAGGIMLFFTLLSGLPAWARNESEVLVFVSSSMPDDAIDSIQCQAGMIDVPLVLRGLIDHSLQKTVQWSAKWIARDTDKSGSKKGFQINPVLFRDYHIEQVPAVLVRSGDAYAVVYGNVTLDYALKTISERHEYAHSVSETAGKALARFKSSRKRTC